MNSSDPVNPTLISTLFSSSSVKFKTCETKNKSMMAIGYTNIIMIHKTYQAEVPIHILLSKEIMIMKMMSDSALKKQLTFRCRVMRPSFESAK